MTATQTRAAWTAAVCALAALALLLPDAALAQVGGSGDITAGLNRGFLWAVGAVRIIGGLIFLAGFIMFAAGRFHWQSGIIMVIGLLGAAKADFIATYIMGA